MHTSPIPAFDLGEQHHALSEEIHSALERVFTSGRFILGEEVTAFEKEVATFIGTRDAIACASGTDALHLALRAAGITKNDEVITSAFSFIASAEAILYTDATPVFADIDLSTFTLSSTSVENALSPKTRAIIAVHLYGHPANMSALSAIAKHHNLILIEDCAQAFGARHNGRYTGAISHVGCHSFFPTKNLGGYGDGGMITTDDKDIAQSIRLLRNHGSAGNPRHKIIGYNSRLDEIQAAILRIKLKHIKKFNLKRQQIASLYTDILQPHLQTPHCTTECEHVFNQYTILCKQRDVIKNALNEAQINSRIYYPIALPEQPALQNVCRSVSYDKTIRATRECLSLPMFPELPAQDAKRVATTIIKALS